jgi:hypothetical protein
VILINKNSAKRILSEPVYTSFFMSHILPYFTSMQEHSEGQRFRTKVSEIWMDREEIMHVEFSKNITLSLGHMEEAYKIFRDLGFGPGQNKSRQLLSGGPITISKEARDFAGKNGTDYFVAAAMVTDSVFMRYVINLFNTIQKHKVPFKLFATEEEALAWLRTFSVK